MSYSPLQVAELFAMAISQRDSGLAESCCLGTSWTDSTSTPYDFFHQAKRKRFQIHALSESCHENRALVPIQLLRGEHSRFGGYLLFIQENTSWKIISVVNGREHAEHYLEGTISARFSVDELEASPSAEDFLLSLWQRLQAGDEIDRDNYTTNAWEIVRYFAQEIVANQAQLEIERSYLLPEMLRAGLDFRLKKTSEQRELSLILWKEKEEYSWRPLQLCSFVDISSLLADPYGIDVNDLKMML